MRAVVASIFVACILRIFDWSYGFLEVPVLMLYSGEAGAPVRDLVGPFPSVPVNDIAIVKISRDSFRSAYVATQPLALRTAAIWSDSNRPVWAVVDIRGTASQDPRLRGA